METSQMTKQYLQHPFMVLKAVILKKEQ